MGWLQKIVREFVIQQPAIPTKSLGNISGKLPCLKDEVATGPLCYQIKDGRQLGLQSLGTKYEWLNPS